MSGNNTDSNDEAENGSFDLDDRDGSDNGSGTQVFCLHGYSLAWLFY